MRITLLYGVLMPLFVPLIVRRLIAAVACVCLLVGATGCGEQPPTKAEKAEKANSKCREKWRNLGKPLRVNVDATYPSGLSDRWNSVVATIDYYAISAKARDCEQRLDDQITAVAQLVIFGNDLRPYDMPVQVLTLRSAVDSYLAEPLPKPPAGKGRPIPPPSKKAVQKAWKQLVTHATPSVEELRPGWDQANLIALNDKKQVTQTLKDLDFLAGDGPHWLQANAALAVIQAALRARANAGR